MKQAWTMAACVALAAGAASASEVSLRSLLEEMVDRDAIARRPSPAYLCLQASSHDRKQVSPDDPAGWFANADHDQFLRIEERGGRKEWVILDHEGPGAIVRFWTPLWNKRTQTVIRFYLDGSDRPAIEANYFDFMRGDLFVHRPFAFAATDETDTKSGVAGDLYLPIPFARRCVITLDDVPFYYVINYRAYEAGTAVRSFDMEDYRACADGLAKTAARLGAPGLAAGGAASLSGDLGKAVELPAGPGAVRQVRVTLPKDTPAQAMRSVAVVMEFDGEETVWCPLGAFFGCGTRFLPVEDWYRTVSADGTMTCRWVMPYEKSGRISLKNLGKDPVVARLEVATGPWAWDDRSMHFHANWRQQSPLNTREKSDWNYVEVAGAGVYAGDTLTVFNPVAQWYGEGDERVYVDGEKVPSHLGTGTEDYYGYAWGMARRFDSPFIAMPRRDAAGRQDWTGHTTTSRVRLLDGVPFARSFRIDMEVWHWAAADTAYAAGTMWYARPGAKCNRGPAPGEAARPLEVCEPPKPEPSLPGAVECERLKPAAASPGLDVDTQHIPALHWSGGGQMFVKATRAGDFVELSIPVREPGPAKVSVVPTRSYDYGILRFSVNGRVAVERWDGYTVASVRGEPVELGAVQPVDGRIVLRVEVTGANPAAKPAGRMYFGLDCVVLGRP